MKRIRVRNISWKDYGISVQTQRELKEFCFLYDEKKKRGNSIWNLMIRWDVFRLERQIFMDTEENSMRVC